MGNYHKTNTAVMPNTTGEEKRQTRHIRFLIEKKKLEAMVHRFFCDGRANLAEDAHILAQSKIVDELLNKEMVH